MIYFYIFSEQITIGYTQAHSASFKFYYDFTHKSA